jgi:hypothetical protein
LPHVQRSLATPPFFFPLPASTDVLSQDLQKNALRLHGTMSSTLLLAMLRDCLSNAVRAAQLLLQRDFIRDQTSDTFSMATLRNRMRDDGTFHDHRTRLAMALLATSSADDGRLIVAIFMVWVAGLLHRKWRGPRCGLDGSVEL